MKYYRSNLKQHSRPLVAGRSGTLKLTELLIKLSLNSKKIAIYFRTVSSLFGNVILATL